jgi:membrane protein implicated in regulation of membrane protease activity
VKWIASFAFWLCLAGAIVAVMFQLVATKLWLGAAVFLAISTIAATLERTNLQKRFED